MGCDVIVGSPRCPEIVIDWLWVICKTNVNILKKSNEKTKPFNYSNKLT